MWTAFGDTADYGWAIYLGNSSVYYDALHRHTPKVF
eukprot:gene8525-19152_t